MSLEPDRRYDGTILDAGLTQLGEQNKPALWFRIKTAEGTAEFIQWCTPAAIKQARKTMQECFGTTEAQLSDTAYFDTLGDRIRDAEVSITTKFEEREDAEGNPAGGEVRVQWMNPRGAKKTPPTPATKSRVAALFGGGGNVAPAPAPGGAPADPSWPSDSDVPF